MSFAFFIKHVNHTPELISTVYWALQLAVDITFFVPNWPKFDQIFAKNCDIFFCPEYFLLFFVDFKCVFEKNLDI